MKICPVAAQFLHADKQTDMTKLLFAICKHMYNLSVTPRQYYIKHTDHHRSQIRYLKKKQKQKLLHDTKCPVFDFIL